MPAPEDRYFDFASKVSFYEFIQEEFRKSKLKLEDYKEEIAILAKKQNWNISELSDFVKKYPNSFIIFQELFQMLRFTNTQLIHFVFDIVKLNSTDLDLLFEYLIMNLKHDIEFRGIYMKLLDPSLTYDRFFENIKRYDKRRMIAVFKLAVSKYVEKIVKDFDILLKRCSKPEFEDFSIRFSNYLLNNLKLNSMLSAINVSDYVKNKQIPVDTKGMHGKFLRLKIVQVLEERGFVNIDRQLRRSGVNTVTGNVKRYLNDVGPVGASMFCTERYVEGIVKLKDQKPKKFDLMIFSDYVPKYLFEMNFYSTSGTKIGINQGEYIDLNNFIKENFSQYEFYWITDGNYWLSPDGRERFINLLSYFEKVYNINLFKEDLHKFG